MRTKCQRQDTNLYSYSPSQHNVEGHRVGRIVEGHHVGRIIEGHHVGQIIEGHRVGWITYNAHKFDDQIGQRRHKI
jgi:hypothetical protein